MNTRTIAVFDSGVGGLSVLRVLHQRIPQVHWVYCADSAHAPYGDRSEAEVQHRTSLIARWLVEQHRPDQLVVACNTATAWAIERLRQNHPSLPIVGVEPALKPAATLSRSGHVGVVATSGTLSSPRFAALAQSVRKHVSLPELRISTQACPGLADAIERDDQATIRQLCIRYANELMAQSANHVPIDTLVLGCTHYPFAQEHWKAAFGPAVALMDNAEAIARRALELLASSSVLSERGNRSTASLHTSGHPDALALATHRWIPELPVCGSHRLPV